ncbi:MAG: MotA/TolQ/ExbB proton channel family protein [Candidatus Binatia bacterium]
MDPSTTQTLAQSMNVVDLIMQGWYVTYPLIAMSVMVTSILIERLWLMRGMAAGIEAVTEDACAPLVEGDVQASAGKLEASMALSPAARVYAPLIPLFSSSTIDDLLEYGERRRLDEVRRLKGNIWVLGTVAASAPFIGLLGTVIGIIKSFHQMAVMGTGGFAVVAAGISEALVATALGLLVAILALLFFNYFQVKIGNIDTQLRVGLGRFVEAGAAAGVAGGGNGAR